MYEIMLGVLEGIMQPHAVVFYNPSELMILLIWYPDPEFKYDFGGVAPALRVVDANLGS